MPNTGIYTRREQFNAVENKHTRVGTLEIDASDVEQTPRMSKITLAAHAHHTHTRKPNLCQHAAQEQRKNALAVTATEEQTRQRYAHTAD